MFPPSNRKTNSFVREAIIILLSIFVSIFLYYPFGAPLLIILLLHRQTVIRLAKWWKPSWIPTSLVGAAAAVDKLNKNKIHSLSVSGELDKPFDIGKFREHVKRFVSGDKNPELKCYFTRWMGISFLKPCPKVSINSLICLNTTTDFKKIKGCLEDFVLEPFQPRQPLWQIMVFTNPKFDKVIVALRFHHALADSMCAMRIFVEFCDTDTGEVGDKFQAEISNLIKKYLPPRPWYQKLLIALDLIFVTPVIGAYTILQAVAVNMGNKAEISGPIIQHIERFDGERIRKLGRKLGYNGNTIFSAALVGAIRQEMMSRGGSADHDANLIYVLPSPNDIHNKFGNNVTATLFKIPISEGDVGQRLRKIDESFLKMRRPAWILQCVLGTKFLCLLTSLAQLNRSPKLVSSGGWTNISSFGIESGLTVMGSEVSNISISLGLQGDSIPVVFCVVKLKDEIILYVSTYESIFPGRDGLQNFFNHFEQELVSFAEM